MCVSARTCVRACVRACVCVCVRARACVSLNYCYFSISVEARTALATRLIALSCFWRKRGGGEGRFCRVPNSDSSMSLSLSQMVRVTYLVTSGRMSQGRAAEHSTVHPTLTCPTDILCLLTIAATDLCGTQELGAMQTEPMNTEKRQFWGQ